MIKIIDNFQKWALSKGPDLDFESIESFTPLREQASLRRYFRILTNNGTKIGVVSELGSSENELFKHFSQFFIQNGIRAPKVEALDIEKGFMIVEDFGDKVLQLFISPDNKEIFFKAAIEEIYKIQSCNTSITLKTLSEEDLKNQMSLFETWFLEELLNFNLSDDDRIIVHDSWKKIALNCSKQPYVLCHFDFEFRNLMLLSDNNIGVLDFQDLCFGPYGLDLASILMDIDHPIDRREFREYLDFYKHLTQKEGKEENYSLAEMEKDVDYSGFQRQFRILGTLSRLHIRDKKSFRLPDLSQTLKYLIKGSYKYSELEELGAFLDEKMLPRLNEFLGMIK